MPSARAGTNATFSAAAGGPRTARALGVVAAPNGELPPDSQPPEPVFFESQQSLDGSGLNGKRRVRKASYVEAPIHQVPPLSLLLRVSPSGPPTKLHHDLWRTSTFNQPHSTPIRADALQICGNPSQMALRQCGCLTSSAASACI